MKYKLIVCAVHIKGSFVGFYDRFSVYYHFHQPALTGTDCIQKIVALQHSLAKFMRSTSLNCLQWSDFLDHEKKKFLLEP